MTAEIALPEVAGDLEARFAGCVLEAGVSGLVINPEGLGDVCRYLRDTPAYSFDYLASLAAVDYGDRFELVYHLVSTIDNHRLTLRARLTDRSQPELPSVTPVWRSGELQEREAFDLFGIRFAGHPDLRRIFTWDGFPGHPLRKDFAL